MASINGTGGNGKAPPSNQGQDIPTGDEDRSIDPDDAGAVGEPSDAYVAGDPSDGLPSTAQSSEEIDIERTIKALDELVLRRGLSITADLRTAKEELRTELTEMENDLFLEDVDRDHALDDEVVDGNRLQSLQWILRHIDTAIDFFSQPDIALARTNMSLAPGEIDGEPSLEEYARIRKVVQWVYADMTRRSQQTLVRTGPVLTRLNAIASSDDSAHNALRTRAERIHANASGVPHTRRNALGVLNSTRSLQSIELLLLPQDDPRSAWEYFARAANDLLRSVPKGPDHALIEELIDSTRKPSDTTAEQWPFHDVIVRMTFEEGALVAITVQALELDEERIERNRHLLVGTISPNRAGILWSAQSTRTLSDPASTLLPLIDFLLSGNQLSSDGPFHFLPHPSGVEVTRGQHAVKREVQKSLRWLEESEYLASVRADTPSSAEEKGSALNRRIARQFERLEAEKFTPQTARDAFHALLETIRRSEGIDGFRPATMETIVEALERIATKLGMRQGYVALMTSYANVHLLRAIEKLHSAEEVVEQRYLLERLRPFYQHEYFDGREYFIDTMLLGALQTRADELGCRDRLDQVSAEIGKTSTASDSPPIRWEDDPAISRQLERLTADDIMLHEAHTRFHELLDMLPSPEQGGFDSRSTLHIIVTALDRIAQRWQQQSSEAFFFTSNVKRRLLQAIEQISSKREFADARELLGRFAPHYKRKAGINTELFGALWKRGHELGISDLRHDDPDKEEDPEEGSGSASPASDPGSSSSAPAGGSGGGKSCASLSERFRGFADDAPEDRVLTEVEVLLSFGDEDSAFLDPTRAMEASDALFLDAGIVKAAEVPRATPMR